MKRAWMTLTTIGAMTAALVACDRGNQSGTARTAPEGSPMAQSDQRSRDMGADATRNMDKGKSTTQEAKDKVSDAVITTTVKAEIAKDPNLSALKINVDTDNGRVVLHGTAPSPDAREHATALAQGVKGVASVDNQLTIEPGK